MYNDYGWNVWIMANSNPFTGMRSLYLVECREYMQDNGYHMGIPYVSIAHNWNEQEINLYFRNQQPYTKNLAGQPYDYRVKCYRQLCSYWDDEMRA